MWPLFVMMLWVLGAQAAPPPCDLERDEPGVYVLTIDPDDKLNKLFGHTGLLLWHPQFGERAPVYDYGRFAPAPLPELAYKALTQTLRFKQFKDSLGTVLWRYNETNRTVIAQRLALTHEEGSALEQALRDDLVDPEFDYHFIENNCTTKVRDALDATLGGHLRAQLAGPANTTVRAESLRHTAPSLPVWLGVYWGTTQAGSEPISEWEAAYIPVNLMAGVAGASRPGGKPLVAHTCTLVDSTRPRVLEAPPSRDAWLWLAGLTVAALVTLLAWASRTAGVWGVAIVGLVGGLFGSAMYLLTDLGTFNPAWNGYNLWFVSPAWLLLPLAARWRAQSATTPLPLVVVGLLGAMAVYGLVLGLQDGLVTENLGLLGLVVPSLVVAGWVLRPRPAA